MVVSKIPLEASYRKDNGIWVLHLDTVVLPADFQIAEHSLVSVPPQTIAGNHRHKRAEAFIATGKDLIFHWLDTKGRRHSDPMFVDGELMLFVVPSDVPHAVENKSSHSPEILYEFADNKEHIVERVSVV